MQPLQRQLRDVQLCLPSLQPPADDPRDRADSEELHVVRDLAAVEVVHEVGSDVQAFDDLVPSACSTRAVQDIDERPLECRDLERNALPFLPNGQEVRLAGCDQGAVGPYDRELHTLQNNRNTA